MRLKLYQLLGLVLLLSVGLYTSGCVSGAYGFQTGRAMGKGAGEVILDVSFVGASVDGDFGGAPAGGIGGRVGVSEKFDVGVVLSSSSLPYVFGRYQVVGDQFSQIALSLGAGGGYLGLADLGGGYFHFPAYFSVHKGDFAWYLMPQYSLFWGTAGRGNTATASLISASTGVEYFMGPHVGVAVNLGWAKPLNDGFDFFSVFNAGLGLKFRFGN